MHPPSISTTTSSLLLTALTTLTTRQPLPNPRDAILNCGPGSIALTHYCRHNRVPECVSTDDIDLTNAPGICKSCVCVRRVGKMVALLQYLEGHPGEGILGLDVDGARYEQSADEVVRLTREGFVVMDGVQWVRRWLRRRMLYE
ncbi:MAG: hypothetical protein Q9178_001839 [Gyalolechia marmorata]